MWIGIRNSSQQRWLVPTSWRPRWESDGHRIIDLAPSDAPPVDVPQIYAPATPAPPPAAPRKRRSR